MGYLSANPAGPDPSGERPVRREPASKGHWLWIIALAAIVAVGFWYFRGSHASTEAQGPAAPGGSGQGQGRGAGAGGFGGPARVAPAPRRDLPVSFNGLWSGSGFNTLPVPRPRGGRLHQNNSP